MTQPHHSEIHWLLDEARRCGAHKADAILIDSTSVSVSCRLGKQDNLERSESSGIGLRVWVADAFAIVSSSDLKRDSLKQLAERATAMARIATPDPFARLADSALLTRKPTHYDIFDATPLSIETMFASALEAEDSARSTTGITNSEGADASYSTYHITIATSEGFTHHYDATSHMLSACVIAGDGASMQRDHEYSVARHLNDMMSPAVIGQRAAEKTLARLNPTKKATCKLPVVFSPQVGRSLISAFASGINGAAVARGTSFLKDRMGQQLFAPHIRIVDDATRMRGIASRPCDGEGVAASQRIMVDNGILQSWLLDTRSAAQLGLQSTGHASRSMSSPPSPSSTNLYMEAGNITRNAMLANITEGFYVTETFGMGVNTVTGNYSQGASGFWIEQGEIAYPVSEMTIAGILPDMFAQMTPADDLSFKYSTNTPTLLVEGMTIAGS
jgi:PmbA protein